MAISLAGGSKEATEVGVVGAKVGVAGVWCQVQQVLSAVVCARMDKQPGVGVEWLSLVVSALGGREVTPSPGPAGEGGGKRQVMFRMVMRRIVWVLACILRVASCEDMEGIVKALDEQVRVCMYAPRLLHCGPPP